MLQGFKTLGRNQTIVILKFIVFENLFQTGDLFHPVINLNKGKNIL
tara:strand:- start:416 stop:553 length:138 start_codon:yes stop_codon:yes gene_type:complete